MEKLLHERLREWAKDAAPIYAAKNYYDCFDSLFDSLADEIERCYIPRPRFEDGEPVQFGDETSLQDCVEAMLFKADGSYELHQKFKNQCGTSVAIYEPNEFVKRHTPKVYDADEVEIKVGDTVYENTKDEPLTVYEVNSLYVHAKTGSGGIRGNLSACYLTHERPVFDADGTRICKGDTVWHKDTGEKHFVEELTGDGGIYIDRSSITWGGDMFTHREPDSYEKTRDDLVEFANDRLDGYAKGQALGIADRLTALIERGA